MLPASHHRRNSFRVCNRPARKDAKPQQTAAISADQRSVLRLDANVRSCVFFRLILLGVILAFTPILPAFSQPPVDSPLRAEAFSSTVITVAIDGQTMQEAIDQIVQQVDSGSRPQRWTWWRDGSIDPHQIVSLNLAGGSAAQAITQLTKPQGWEAFPIPGILLVGRPEWIDRTLAHCVSSPQATSVDLTWPRGTTSREAMRRVVETSGASVPIAADFDWLPHDVWREANFQQVDPWHVASLMLSEFRYVTPRAFPLERLVTRDGELPPQVEFLSPEDTRWKNVRFQMSYPVQGSGTAIRQAVQSFDRTAAFRSGRDGQQRLLRVNTTPAGHRAAWRAVWENAEVPAQIARAGREATYDLKLLNKPAEVVLQQFAGAAGKQLKISEDAKLRSQTLVSLDAQKKTLRELAESIAQQANLQLVWGDVLIEVSLPAEE